MPRKICATCEYSQRTFLERQLVFCKYEQRIPPPIFEITHTCKHHKPKVQTKPIHRRRKDQ